MTLHIPTVQLDPDLPLPAYAQEHDAGLDLRARTSATIEPGQRHLMPTGIALAIPPGYVGLIHPRSGNALKHGLTIANAPGTIDAGYRGEICVILVNLDPTTPVAITRGDRIAQLVIQKVEHATLTPAGTLDNTTRGTTGFGSTGHK